jgi:6-phosphogluconolactonase (cycloisomerase 2 family)
VDPSGSFVYIVDSNFGLLLSYTVQSNGKLMASGSSPLVGNPTSITTAPEGDFVYVTMEGDGSALSGEIRRFSINVLDGKLSVLAPQATPGGPSSLSFNSHGTRAYVTMFVDNTAHSYNVASDGSLVEIGTGTTTQPDPRHVALSRDGRFAYVAFEDGPGNGGILLYDIDSTSGEMSVPQWVDAEAAGINPSQTLISPSGAHAYVLARGSESILTFDVSPQDGRLTVSQIQSLGLGPNRIAPSLILE